MAISKIEFASLATGVPSSSQLPAGTVLQVVQATYSTPVSNSSSTYVDTGLTATITPTSASSKILVMVSQASSFVVATNGGGLGLKLQRNGSDIFTPSSVESGSPASIYVQANGTSYVGSYSYIVFQYLDSPASTSTTVYKTQGRPYATNNSMTSTFQWSGVTSAAPSIITLMEIAA